MAMRLSEESEREKRVGTRGGKRAAEGEEMAGGEGEGAAAAGGGCGGEGGEGAHARHARRRSLGREEIGDLGLEETDRVWVWGFDGKGFGVAKVDEPREGARVAGFRHQRLEIWEFFSRKCDISGQISNF